MQIEQRADQDPAEAAARASALGDAGVDKVIFTLRTPYSASVVEALAEQLEPLR